MTTPSHEPARMHIRVSDATPSAPACRRIPGTGRERTGGLLRGMAVLLALGCMAMPAAAAQEESQAEPMSWTTSCDYSVLPGARLKSRTALRDAALVSGNVSLGQYTRYRSMQSVLAEAYYTNHIDLISDIEAGEKAYKIGKIVSTAVSLSSTAKNAHKFFANRETVFPAAKLMINGGRGTTLKTTSKHWVVK